MCVSKLPAVCFIIDAQTWACVSNDLQRFSSGILHYYCFISNLHLQRAKRMLSISVSEEQRVLMSLSGRELTAFVYVSIAGYKVPFHACWGNPCSDCCCCFCGSRSIPSACCPVSPFGTAHTFGKAHLKVKVQQLVGIVSGSLPLGAVPAELSKTLAN